MACQFVEELIDEGAQIIQRGFFRPPPAPRVFRERTNPLEQSDSFLWERYRFSRQSIVYLCSLLEPHIKRVTCRSQSLTTVQSVCIALRFFASGTFLYSVGDAEGLSKATTCREVRVVYLALKEFLNVFITFPSHHGIQRIKEGFYAIAGFPNVLGCIDCTHVQIQAPPGPVEKDFADRRNNHSLNVQMICDSDYLITNIEAKWPGGVHDARILRESHLAQGEFEWVLLGDRGYPCLPYLLTPYPEPRTAAEVAFNNALSATRARIEMVFGLLKSRFQCLKYLRWAPDRACDIVVACAVLHNIATIRKERLPEILNKERWEEPAPVQGLTDGRTPENTYFS